jgi:hypothetical protein
MVWFFERKSERLQYEIRHEPAGNGYELVIIAPSEQKIEKVDSAAALIERSQDVWAGLISGGWRPLSAQAPPSLGFISQSRF